MTIAEDFWRFSLAVYGRSGVADCCIALQDRRGFNVNLLLYGCFAGAEGIKLTTEDWERALKRATPWQTDIVGPLRAVRRRLTADQDPAVQALRKSLLALEIEGERIEQAQLSSLLPNKSCDPSPRLAAENLQRLCNKRGIKPTAADVADLTALLTAAFPDLPPLACVWMLLPDTA